MEQTPEEFCKLTASQQNSGSIFILSSCGTTAHDELVLLCIEVRHS
jgi:hypothetical protein